MKFLIALILLFTIGCKDKTTKTSKKQESIVIPLNNRKILLINEFKIDNAKNYGYKSFIINSSKGKLLCSVKHSIDFAIVSKKADNKDKFNSTLEIKHNEINDKFKYWKAYTNPKNKTLKSTDTIYARSFVNTINEGHDIILLNIDQNFTDIKSLNPSFETLTKNDKFQLITCVSNDSDFCEEKVIDCELVSNSDKSGRFTLEVDFKEEFTPTLTGGSPIINAQGNVVGIVSGAYQNIDFTRLIVEPIGKIKKWL